MPAPKEPKPSNPLLSKNIPPPPMPAPTQAPMPRPQEGDYDQMLMHATQAPPTRATTTKPIEERATVELSLYIKPAQDDKLEDLRRAYKRHTGKKISANEVMRRLIDRATLETLL